MDYKTARNLYYLERKGLMPRGNSFPAGGLPPGGVPMIGMPHPQQQQFNPLLNLFLPCFFQTIQTQQTVKPDASAVAVVDYAWEAANRAFAKLGFAYSNEPGPLSWHKIEVPEAERNGGGE